MRSRPFDTIRVRARPGQPTQGWMVAGPWTLPVALGRGGIKANKREGDGATPRGRYRLLRLWLRPDRGVRPSTGLPQTLIARDTAWCEDPQSRRYNRPFRRSAEEAGDRMWREDGLYDLVIEIAHNTRPRTANLGSAVFIHVARPGFKPTAGCVALRDGDLRRLLARLGPRTVIDIGEGSARRAGARLVTRA